MPKFNLQQKFCNVLVSGNWRSYDFNSIGASARYLSDSPKRIMNESSRIPGITQWTYICNSCKTWFENLPFALISLRLCIMFPTRSFVLKCQFSISLFLLLLTVNISTYLVSSRADKSFYDDKCCQAAEIMAIFRSDCFQGVRRNLFLENIIKVGIVSDKKTGKDILRATINAIQGRNC